MPRAVAIDGLRVIATWSGGAANIDTEEQKHLYILLRNAWSR